MQKDNVANQREHLILLLANVHIRNFPKPDQQPKVFSLVTMFWLLFQVSELVFLLLLMFSHVPIYHLDG